MNSTNENLSEQRQNMGSLLDARKETLSLYSELASLRPFEEEHDVTVVLQEFCETLMDYTASAHFQLYRFLDFNDKYEVEHKGKHLSSLDNDLSSLGEIIADRIVYEDQVISAFESPISKSAVA